VANGDSGEAAATADSAAEVFRNERRFMREILPGVLIVGTLPAGVRRLKEVARFSGRKPAE
jgi:hypothetical protein